jgi:tRNA/rRNA methyltransferase
LFNRAELTQEEIHILRGIAKSILQQASKPPSSALANALPDCKAERSD